MNFRFRSLAIPEVILIEGNAFDDERGLFLEAYKRSVFAAYGIAQDFVQDNYSRSARGVLRGLHYQIHPKAQAKLVVVLDGEVFDVAVDIRGGSPTYGRWVAEILSSKNRSMMYVPVGFAHGFCALSERAGVLYKVTEEYAPEYERGVLWSDPDLKIPWPVDPPLVSTRDASLPRLNAADTGFVFQGGLTH